MSDMQELYQDLIKGHSKNPVNYREMADSSRKVEGYNPLCGDRFTVYLKLDNDIVKDISFQGKGCAISTASASLMTQCLKGKTTAEAEAKFHDFHEFVIGEAPNADEEALGKLVAFSGVRKFPARVKCATLAWHTLHSAIVGENKTVSTE